MKAEINSKEFEDLQDDFMKRMMESIREFLSEELQWRLELTEEIPMPVICDLAESLGFAVNSVIDGCDVIGLEDQPLPVLAFKKESGKDVKLIAPEGCSYMHEMTAGYFDDWLCDQDEDE